MSEYLKCFKGSHSLIAGGMYPHHMDWAEAQNTSWYRSKEIIPGFYPHYGYLGNKKWPLLKVNANSTIKYLRISLF